MSSASRRAFLMLVAAARRTFELLGMFPDATPGALYDSMLTIDGGVGPYTVDAIDGSLPAGLVLEVHTDGDKVRLHGTVPLALVVLGRLPQPVHGQFYDQSLTLSGAVGVCTLSYAGGALPSWMTATMDAAVPPTFIRFTGMPS